MSFRSNDTSSATRARRRRFLQHALLTLGLNVGEMARAQPSAANPTVPKPTDRTSFYANFDGLKLVDQDGRPLMTSQLLGHLVLVNFVFTRCSTVCPVQTRALADMQRQMPPSLRAHVRLLSISLDPLSDKPETLKAFAQRMGADLADWRFATGRPQDVEQLVNALRLFRPTPDARRPEDHSTALWLVDRQGQLRMRYSGSSPDVPRLLREMAALDDMRAHPPG